MNRKGQDRLYVYIQSSFSPTSTSIRSQQIWYRRKLVQFTTWPRYPRRSKSSEIWSPRLFVKPALSTGCNIAKTSVEFDSRRLREWDAIGPESTQKQIKHTVDYYYSDFNKLPTYWTPCNITRSQLTHAFLVLTLKFVTPEFFKIYSLQCARVSNTPLHYAVCECIPRLSSRLDLELSHEGSEIWYNVRKPYTHLLPLILTPEEERSMRFPQLLRGSVLLFLLFSVSC